MCWCQCLSRSNINRILCINIIVATSPFLCFIDSYWCIDVTNWLIHNCLVFSKIFREWCVLCVFVTDIFYFNFSIWKLTKHWFSLFIVYKDKDWVSVWAIFILFISIQLHYLFFCITRPTKSAFAPNQSNFDGFFTTKNIHTVTCIWSLHAYLMVCEIYLQISK